MSDEGYIEPISFSKAWGSVLIPLFEENEWMITEKGIHYLEDNDKMKTVGKFLIEKADTIVAMAVSAGLEAVFK